MPLACSEGKCHEGPSLTPCGGTYSNIWEACQNGNLEELKIILTDCPELVNTPGPTDQVPPLHWAALNDHCECCNYLLERGAAVNQLGGSQWSSALHWACYRGNIGVVALLIQRGADFLQLRDQQGYLPIHIAAQNGQPFCLLHLISLCPNADAIVDSTDLHGRTALIWASYRGHDEAVQVLLDENANVHIKDRSGYNALLWAVIKGNSKAIRLLLSASADLSEPDGEGKTCATWAKEKAWSWYDDLIAEFGHGQVKLVAFQENGATSKKRRWLPERLFKPLLDDQSKKWVFGRLLPPFITLACLYVAAYAINIVIGLLLVFLISGGSHFLYKTFLKKSSTFNADSFQQHQTDIPVLNTVHFTLIGVGVLAHLYYFLPAQTSSRTLHAAVLVYCFLIPYSLYKVSVKDPGRIGKPQSDEERRAVHQICLAIRF